MFKLRLICTAMALLAFCLHVNVYIVLICIIAGALPMFSARECVPDNIKKYCPRAIFSSTPPREQGVYGYYGHIAPVTSKYEEIYPYSAMNMGSVKIHTSLIIMRESLIH